MTDLHVLEFVELVLKPCVHVYGSAPCTASIGTTGSCKCYQSPATCQDPLNFSPGEQVVRWAVPSASIPVEIDCIPSLKGVSVRSQKVNPGESLGTRESVTAQFVNHAHNDAGFDRYLADREFNPYTTGTFWGKFVARWPNLQGCEFRYVKGFVGQDIAAMERRYYVVDSTSGPDNAGGFSITAKDAIKFLDNDKAVAPLPSPGVLAADISDTDTTLTLSPAGVGDASYPTSGIASIGDEKVSFTRSGDAITLTQRELDGSHRGEHKADETFQLALVFSAQDPANILNTLISDYTDTPADYINHAAWLAETSAYISRLFSADICKPTGVKKLIDELIVSVGLIVFTDTVQKKISLRALRKSVPILSLSDGRYMDGTLTAKYDFDKRISQVIHYYGQKNSLENVDNVKNYFGIATEFADDPVSALENAPQSIKTIFSRWITIFNRPAAEAVNSFLIKRYKRAPRSVGFKLPVNISVDLGSVITLETKAFEDSQGMPLAPGAYQIVSAEPTESGLTILAEEIPVTEDAPDDGIFIVNIDSNSYNLNLRTIYDTIYLPPVAGNEVHFVFASGVFVGSLDRHSPAVNVGSWPEGVIIKIIHAPGARIQGKGGNGGTGPYNAGEYGSDALFVQYPVELVGDWQIWGGGGGGGSYFVSAGIWSPGGGGAGFIPGNNGATTEHGGGGYTYTTNGGMPGMPGETGTGSYGGAEGNAIVGLSYVTFTGTPDIRGPQIG